MSKQQIASDLKERGFSPAKVKKCGYVIRDAKYTLNKTGFEVPSLEIPYRDIHGKIIRGGSRFKLYWTEEEKKAWRKGKPPKYVSLKGEEPHLYYSNLLHGDFGSYEDVSVDTNIPIIITEGEFKTDVGCEAGFMVIGIAGVWSWKSNKKKLPVIPDLKEIDWVNREVYLTFDSDLRTNIKVREALNALAKWMTQQGAIVYIAFLPELPEYPNTGLDDFLHLRGAEALEEIIEHELEPYNYCEELLKLNTEVGFVRDPGIVVEHRTGLLMSPNNFVNAHYSNRHYYVDTAKGVVQKKAAKAWMDFPQRNEYKELTYRPGEERVTSDMCYNTWRSWGVKPKKGSVKPWKELMYRIFGRAEETQHWFEQWLAYPLQHPGTKLNTACVMVSREQGTGKSMIGYIMGKIHGDNFGTIGNEQLDSTFTSWLERKTFILGEEITGNDKKSYQNKLKRLITQEKATINTKGLREFELPDCANYYFTSNHCNAVYIDNADRRYFVWQFHDYSDMYERARWFKDNLAPWYNGDGPAHLFHYLLHLDMTGFDPDAPAPMTASKRDMVSDSKGDLGAWIVELERNPDDVLKMDGVVLKSDIYTPNQLHELCGLKTVTVSSFGRQLKDMGGFPKFRVRVPYGDIVTLYVVRNVANWVKKKPKQIREHWENHFPDLAHKPKKY